MLFFGPRNKKQKKFIVCDASGDRHKIKAHGWETENGVISFYRYDIAGHRGIVAMFNSFLYVKGS